MEGRMKIFLIKYLIDMFVHILVQLLRLRAYSRFRYRYPYYYKTDIDFITKLDKIRNSRILIHLLFTMKMY